MRKMSCHMENDIEVRRERRADVAAVRRVNEIAFGRAAEADLVDRLRDADRVVSMVAVSAEGEVVGHVLLTPATIRSDQREIAGAALGPVAVLPQFQRAGIGAALVRDGMDEVQRRGDPFVIVLGHPSYYPRFGFEPAGSRYGVRCKWDVPDDVFMIRIFDADTMRGVIGVAGGGVAHYRPEFDAV
jgi:putative acetyltransferase